MGLRRRSGPIRDIPAGKVAYVNVDLEVRWHTISSHSVSVRADIIQKAHTNFPILDEDTGGS